MLRLRLRRTGERERGDRDRDLDPDFLGDGERDRDAERRGDPAGAGERSRTLSSPRGERGGEPDFRSPLSDMAKIVLFLLVGHVMESARKNYTQEARVYMSSYSMHRHKWKRYHDVMSAQKYIDTSFKITNISEE